MIVQSRKRILFLAIFYFVLTELSAANVTLQADTLEQRLNKLSAAEQLSYLTALSNKYIFIDASQGLKLAERAVKLALKLNDSKGEAKALIGLGKNYWKLDNYSLALEKIGNAKKIFEEINDQEGIADALGEFGIIYIYMAKYSTAVEVLIESAEISNKNDFKELLAPTYKRLGIVYWYLKQYDKSLEYYQKALKITETFNKPLELASLHNNIALIYYDQQKYDKAYTSFQKSYELYKKGKDREGISIALTNMGDVLIKIKNYEKALEVSLEALKINRELNAKFNQVACYINIGIIYREFKQYDKAKTYLELALSIAKEIKAVNEVADAYLNISQIDEKLGNLPDALKFYKLHKEFNDSVFNKSSADKIAEMQTKYETKMKNAENELLKKQNDLQNEKLRTQQKFVITICLGLIIAIVLLFVLMMNRKKLMKAKEEIEMREKEILAKNITLAELNATKNKFFSIIAHDLKGPFQGFIGLTEMMSEDITTFSQAELSTLIKKMNNAVRNLYKLLVNLLDWAQMQKGTIDYSPQECSLSEIVNNNLNTLEAKATQKGIALFNTIPEKIKIYADEKMINATIRNLLSNSVKFTKKEGKVSISAKETENNLVEISVTDTGVGMTEEHRNNLFKLEEKVGRKGTDGEDSTGLGLLLCKEFVGKHGGKIWAESQEGIGSTFYFTMPSAN